MLAQSEECPSKVLVRLLTTDGGEFESRPRHKVVGKVLSAPSVEQGKVERKNTFKHFFEQIQSDKSFRSERERPHFTFGISRSDLLLSRRNLERSTD